MRMVDTFLCADVEAGLKPAPTSTGETIHRGHGRLAEVSWALANGSTCGDNAPERSVTLDHPLLSEYARSRIIR
jgi:hypothetical protein